jgi:site-specific DNA recombinase
LKATSEAWQEREAIRGLIDEVSLEPADDQLRIILKGNVAGMLRLAQENKRPSETDDLLDQIMLVAGAGFEPATFGL